MSGTGQLEDGAAMWRPQFHIQKEEATVSGTGQLEDGAARRRPQFDRSVSAEHGASTGLWEGALAGPSG